MSWVSSAFDGNDVFNLEEDSTKRSISRGGMKMKQKKTSGAVRPDRACSVGGVGGRRWGDTKMVDNICGF